MTTRPPLPLIGSTGLGERLRLLLESRSRLRDLAVAALIVAACAYATRSIAFTYPIWFTLFVAVAIVVFMIENQEKTLYLLLWFSTIYLMLKATLLGWSGMAFLFKEGFLALLFAFWVFQLILRQERLRPSPLNGPVGLLLAWLVLECFNPNTAGFLTTVDDLRYWAGPLIVYFLTVHLIDNRTKLEQALKVVFAYAALEAVYGIAQQAMPGDLLVTLGADPNSYFYFHQGSIRSFSTMGTAGFALFASMFPTISFFYMTQQRTPLHRWFFLALGFVFMAGVLFTLVRTGWVAVAVATVAYALVTRRTAILVVLLLIVLGILIGSTGYMRWKIEGLINYEEDVSIQRRIEIAGMVSKGIVFRVFGYGLGTFAHNRFGYGMQDKIGYGTATENWYLLASLELGWVGIAILVWIWYKVYRFAWGAYRGGLRTRRYRELAIALAGSLFAIDVARLGGPAGYYPPDSWHYWFFVALLMVLPRVDAELAAEEEAAAAPAVAVLARGAVPAAAAVARPATA